LLLADKDYTIMSDHLFFWWALKLDYACNHTENIITDVFYSAFTNVFFKFLSRFNVFWRLYILTWTFYIGSPLCCLKAKLRYTSFPTSGHQQFRNQLARLPRSKSTTSPQHKRQVHNESVTRPQQVRNKYVTSWRGQKSVVSVVSCCFPNSITTTCYGLVVRVANKSVTSRQLPRLRISYVETYVQQSRLSSPVVIR